MPMQTAEPKNCILSYLVSDILLHVFSLTHFEIYRIAINVKMTTRKENLDPGRVHHDPHPPSHRLRRQVLGELCPHGPSVAVRARHLAPDHAEVRLLGLVRHRRLVLGL